MRDAEFSFVQDAEFAAVPHIFLIWILSEVSAIGANLASLLVVISLFRGKHGNSESQKKRVVVASWT